MKDMMEAIDAGMTSNGILVEAELSSSGIEDVSSLLGVVGGLMAAADDSMMELLGKVAKVKVKGSNVNEVMRGIEDARNRLDVFAAALAKALPNDDLDLASIYKDDQRRIGRKAAALKP